MQSLVRQRARRVLLIVNPGASRGARFAGAAEASLVRGGAQTDVFIGDRPGSAGERVARDAANYDAIFTLGGDGTVMEVVSALTPAGPPVGILHGGTGNLLAQALRIPRSVPRAVDALLSGDEARIDLGRLSNGRMFAFAAGVGVDANIMERTSAALKRRFGLLAYFVVAYRELPRFRKFMARIDVDGTVTELDASAVLVLNFGTVFGDLVVLGDRIRYDDGLLDVCAFRANTWPGIAAVAGKLMRRDFRSDDRLWYASGKTITVETTPVHTAQADGELIGPTPFTVTVDPLRARVLVPRRR